RKKIEDKLTLTQVQLASIPPVLDGLRAIVEEYKATFQAVDAKPSKQQAEQMKHLRRRLYRAIEQADPLNQAIVKNINDPVTPTTEPKKDEPAAPAAPAEPAAQG
ncbi:MAG TPA: hypothetical protein VL860_13495, partial [Planctomycetota bacterium]|nr:hypothetical protein [Planctomycetota bacterium]